MLLVEGALARVQGALGLIPADAAAFIDRAASEVQIDPAALGHETARNGVPVPALLAAFRKAAGAPTLLQYLHWGATSQDIMDTALALRLRRLLQIWDARLSTLTGQLQNDMPPLRTALLRVSLSGAAGTLSAMGDHGPAARAGLAQALGLSDPGHSWHADRSGIARLAGFAAGLAGSLGKLGEDLILLTQSGIAEVTLSGAGGSSTMPQKENPVAPSALVALSRQVIGLSATLQGAALHRQQRDGAAWFTELLTLPQLCLSTSRMLSLACECLTALRPDPAAMARPLTTGAGLIHAEALTFALAQSMPRPEAQTLVATLCQTALTTGTPLATLVAERFPTLPWPPAAPTGAAPAEARAFAAQARLADPPLVQP
jgi:3-carboxy-cis,cis-muconate cycloisomerase